MNENIKKFYDAIKTDKALQEKAKEMNEKFKDEKPDEATVAQTVTAFAKAAGFDFTAEEFMEYSKADLQELRDDELEAVAGGGCFCSYHGSGDGKAYECNSYSKYYCSCTGYGEGGAFTAQRLECICVNAGMGSGKS